MKHVEKSPDHRPCPAGMGPAVRASAPGRICLFGEHCDYLGLPVIAAAINLRMNVEGREQSERGWVLEMPDIGETDAFDPAAGEVSYRHGQDFLRGAVNLLRREGVVLPAGARFRITGRVPIRAGTSSSSALQVAWVQTLLALAGDSRTNDPRAIAWLAYLSEVEEFKGSGGMMDQTTAALGGLLRIEPGVSPRVQSLPAHLGAFVLGDSQEPKDTQAILARVQSEARGGAERLSRILPGFSFHTTGSAQAEQVVLQAGLDPGEFRCTFGALRNREILEEATAVLSRPEADHRRLGALLNTHHAILRDQLGISTPKIERMLEAALEAGALGGKINGSGGGGCMFAYAPDEPERVALAIKAAGGRPYIVKIDRGVACERVN